MIPGSTFLFKNNCKIDYKKQELSIKNSVTEFSNVRKMQWRKSPDNQLVAKTKICALNNEKDRADLQCFLSNAKEQNPKLGLIKNFTHEIKLKSNVPIGGKMYTVPLHLKEVVQRQVDKLLQQDIIRSSRSLYNASGFPILKKWGTPISRGLSETKYTDT